MNKKILSVLVALGVALSLVGCGEDSDKDDDNDKKPDGSSSIASDKGSAGSDDKTSLKPDGSSEGSSDGSDDRNDADAFIIKFGNVEISEMPVKSKTIYGDGWTPLEYSGEEYHYAEKNGSFIGFTYADSSETLIDTLVISNGNYENGVFDISDIALFGGVDFSAATAHDICSAFDPDGSRRDKDYIFSDMDDYSYIFDFSGIKNCPGFAITRENETDFTLYLSSRVGDSGGDNSGGGSNNDPVIKEDRVYESDYNDTLHILVTIYEDGSWKMEQDDRGAEYICVYYSFAKEAAGEFVQVSGYNLAIDPPEFVFLGHARFTMTESKLLVFYDNDDTAEYHRVYY